MIGGNHSLLFAFALAPKLPALISIFASAYVVVEIIQSAERRSRLYHRTVLTMNILQIIEMSMRFLGTWLIPYGYPGVVGPLGSKLSCKIQGTIITISGSAVFSYYSSLSVISYVAMKNNCEEKRFIKIEPYIHIFSLCPPLMLGIAAWIKDYINPSEAWCRISCPMKVDLDQCQLYHDKRFKLTLNSFVVIHMTILFTMMALVHRNIKMREKLKKRTSRNYFSYKKPSIIIQQIALYIIIFIVFQGVTIIIRLRSKSLHQGMVFALCFVRCWLGFFNMVVYLLLKNSAKDRIATNICKIRCEHIYDSRIHSSTDMVEHMLSNQNESEDPRMNRNYEFSIFEGAKQHSY